MTKFLVRSVLAATLFIGFASTGRTVFAQLQEEQSDTERTAELVDNLVTAEQLIAFGRGELSETTGLTELRSPEALVAAGGIYVRAHKATGGKVQESDVKIEADDGTTIEASSEPYSFADEAEELFDEARAMQTADSAKLEALIKQAKTSTSRGSVRGPRIIKGMVRSGKAQNLRIAFEPNAPARVAMRSSGNTRFQVLGHGGKVLWNSKGTWGYYNWNTGGRNAARKITVRVINRRGPPVAYLVQTN